jgi:hypothetical protein
MATFSTQIELDDRGVSWIAGTKVKVIEVVLDKMAHGSSPEAVRRLRFDFRNSTDSLSTSESVIGSNLRRARKLTNLKRSRCLQRDARR